MRLLLDFYKQYTKSWTPIIVGTADPKPCYSAQSEAGSSSPLYTTLVWRSSRLHWVVTSQDS